LAIFHRIAGMKQEGKIESIRTRLLNLSRANGETFDEVSLSVAPIREDVEDGGVRAKFRAMLGDMPGIALKTYPTCTVIAEKFEALVRLDARNSRMKDFFDLDFLLTGSAQDPGSLDAAIRATFTRRGSTLPTEIPTGLTSAFVEDRRDMWQAFLRKNVLQADGFDEVVARIRLGLEWIWKS
jgi:hypothetical protein